MYLVVFFSVAAALGLLGVLVFVATSGRLSAETRRKIELVLIIAFYPAFAIFFGWRLFTYAIAGDWLPAVLTLGLCVALGVQGFRQLRRRSRSHGQAT